MDGVTQTQATEILRAFAKNVLAFDGANVSETADRVARAGIADTVGVTLAGLPEPCTQILLQTPGIADAPGPCTILGSDKTTSALDAVLVNGTASHALDFDDFSSILGGHQSVPLVAPLLAMAEERVLSGAKVLAAYQAGFEAEHRFAASVHPHHYDKGWHPTATVGIFGTVAALAHLINLDTDKTTLAFAIAASMASGLKANFGTMTKPLHVGHSARAGLMAVLLAERGFDANPAAMEHHQGFLAVFNGEGTFDTTPMTEPWSGPLAIEAETIGIKQFACCGSTHHAIQAMLDLVHKDGVTADAVAKVEVRVHQQRLRHTYNPAPKTVLQAKFSQQYAVARALLDGTVKLKDFEGEAFLEPGIVKLLNITDAVALADGAGEPWDAEVAVTLADGTEKSRRIDNMVGRGGRNAMTEDELFEKFADCWARALPADGARAGFDALMRLDEAADVADLNGMFRKVSA